MSIPAKEAFTIIYNYSNAAGGCYYGTRGYLADMCHCSIRTIDRVLKELLEEKLIIRSERKMGGNTFVSYKPSEKANLLDQGGASSRPPVSVDEFIKAYLLPGHKISKSAQRNFVKEFINEGRGYDKEAIRVYIKDMPYDDFLLTPYWRYISEYVKFKAGYKCQLCGEKTNLQTHHLSYSSHGSELENMRDLVCLCSKCHLNMHNDESK